MLTSLRRAARALAIAGMMAGLAPAARAGYPDHPITFIVPWGAGGGADLLARTAAKIMAPELGVSLPVINVPGATGMVGMTKLLTAPADGYSLAVLIGDTYALQAGPNPRFKLDQLIPLAILIQQPSGYWVKAGGPFKDWNDVMRAARQRPLKVAVTGFGSADDITTRYLARTLGLKLESIPYAKPGLRYSSILGGNADLLYEQTGDVRSYFDAGRIKPVLFFYPHAVPIAPFATVPVSGQLGYDVTLPQFRAIVLRAGTDPAKVKRLADALAKVTTEPSFKAYLAQQYADPHSFVPMAKTRAFMAAWLAQARAVVARTKAP